METGAAAHRLCFCVSTPGYRSVKEDESLAQGQPQPKDVITFVKGVVYACHCMLVPVQSAELCAFLHYGIMMHASL
jgi:hypothetical protein